MNRDKVLPPLRLVIEGFENVGLPPLKARDKREPGRKEKMEFEDRLQSIIVRHFGRQRRLIRDILEANAFLQQKATPKINFDDIYDDQDFITRLMRLFQDATKHGISLFGQTSKLQIDWNLTNLRAFEWAKKYTYDLVKMIDDTTRKLLQSAVSQFVNTPGMTIGDVMDMLPFDEQRAQTVAVTEITRAYATANQLAGEDLKKEFPDVRVVKHWFTNNDDRVCDLCGPLDGVEVEVDENFYDPDEYSDGDPPRHVACRCWMNTTTALAELGD